MIAIKVRDYFQRCGVREKGKEFYRKVLEDVPEEESDIQFDFEGVTFVSAYFLEESIFRLIDNYNVSIVERTRSIEEKAERIIDWKKLNVRLTHEKNILRIVNL